MNSNQPHYKKIAATIKERIAAGLYKPGERIPPIRQLTKTFGVNKATVHRAFVLLQQEGLIENKVGSGSFVRFPTAITASLGGLDLKTDYLNESFFPYAQAQEIINGLFTQEKAHVLAPSPVEGDPNLIQVLSRQYHLPAERMLIISGAQQGLDLVSKVFSAKISESILFEDPTYPGAISLFKARHFVNLDSDGPDLQQFDKAISTPIKLFYAMPSVHNPTGISYSDKKKKAITQRAEQHDFYIIEDDYLGELKAGVMRFVDIAPERTVYIKSFAQTMLAGIRLGLMVVPKTFYDQFIHAKFSSDISSSGLLQKLLHNFIVQGHYATHLKTINKKSSQRRRRLEKLLDQFSFIHYAANQSGYSIWCATDKGIHSPDLAWSRGREFSFSQKHHSYFRIAFMHLDDDRFEQSLGYIKKILSQQKF